MFELVISTKQKCNNGIQCAAQFCFWQGKGCYGPMGVQKASKKVIKQDARIHSKQKPQKINDRSANANLQYASVSLAGAWLGCVMKKCI